MSVELVGVLNLTPDSFSDGGTYTDPAIALAHAEQMFADGASYIDVGGEATNPHAEPISADEEWRRLEPILRVLLPRYGEKISIDTHHPEIARRALELGRFILNDITTFVNPDMIEVAAEHGLTVIASHLPLAAAGNVQDAHELWHHTDPGQVYEELKQQYEAMVAGGIPEGNIILDPGIGFGTTRPLDWELLSFPRYWATTIPSLHPYQPFMIGASRKRFLETDPESGLPISGIDRFGDPSVSVNAAKIAINTMPLNQRLLLRVHDVAAHASLTAL